MSALSKASPLKRKPAESSKTPSKPKTTLEPGNPLWFCLNSQDCPEGRLAVRTKRDGKNYTTCDRNDWKDPDTCKVTCSFLAPSKDHPHNCQICLQDVGGKPSIGFPTDEFNDRGYKVWENYCAVYSLCAGARTKDGGTFKHATAATGDIVGKRCAAWDDKKSSKDNPCTGKIKAGELVVKNWEDPPLHLVCSKREWRKIVDDFLRKQKVLHDLGSTAEKEASQPSAKVPDNLKDF